jgi:hypothetical protein
MLQSTSMSAVLFVSTTCDPPVVSHSARAPRACSLARVHPVRYMCPFAFFGLAAEAL